MSESSDESSKKAAAVKKVYPPTKSELAWQDDLEWHADEIAQTEEGMGNRTLHFCRLMRARASLVAQQDVMGTYRVWSKFCESEIEKIFLMTLISKTCDDNTLLLPDSSWWEKDPYGFLSDGMFSYLAREFPARDPMITGMLMQVPILGYRADFVFYAISAVPGGEDKWLRLPLVVECDGHDFHERTKQQAKRDRARDREMMAAGYRVMRFTGSEIWRDPGACADEALRFLHDRQWEHHLGDHRAGGA